MSKKALNPFLNRKIINPSKKWSSTSFATGFTGRPHTYCRITCYLEPIERQLYFGIDGVEFFIIGKLFVIGGGRAKGLVMESDSTSCLSPDSIVAIKIGLLALSVQIKDYFEKVEGILFSEFKSCATLVKAIQPFLDTKGWVNFEKLSFDSAEGEWESSLAVPFLRSFSIDKFLNTYFEGTLKALEALEAGNHFRDLFVLLQCSFDHMAWLSRPAQQEDVNRSDFCRWVYMYLRLKGDGSLTAGEIYDWRCGWVHSYGGQEPRAYGRLELTNQLSVDYVRNESLTVLCIKTLVEKYKEALYDFTVHCSLNAELRHRVNERLENMPQVIKL